MATNKQKRAKRMKRQQHQHATSTGEKRRDFNDDQSVFLRRGPKPNQQSFHKSDPLEHGRRLDARAQMDAIFRELFGEDFVAGDDLRRDFRKVVRATGSVAAAKAAMSKTFNQVVRDAGGAPGKRPGRRRRRSLEKEAQRQADQATHGFSAEMAGTGERVDPATITPAHDKEG